LIQPINKLGYFWGKLKMSSVDEDKKEKFNKAVFGFQYISDQVI